MAVNLSKNGDLLSTAYNEVRNANTDNDWVLFGYEENSNDIRVAAKGGGGVHEMVKKLDSTNVMYGFCRVKDQDTGVIKFILINWTGESVNGLRRGICANHIKPMASFLWGAHVTINAYSEDDVAPDVIMRKVCPGAGLKYSGQNKEPIHTTNANTDNTAKTNAVGTVYLKINALEEINGLDRERFWAQMEKEEQLRRKEEKKKAEEERQRAEKERIQQEEKATAEREQRMKKTANQIHQQKVLEKKQQMQSTNHQRNDTNEEQTRELERKRAEEEKLRVEKERMQKEEKDKAARETQQKAKAGQIHQQRVYENKQEVQSTNQRRPYTGTVYQKINALEEINGSQRENFWAQMEQEEQARLQQEREKAEEERHRVERERIQQEEKETAEREKRQKERDGQINQQRIFEKRQEVQQQTQGTKEVPTWREQEKRKAVEERQKAEKERFQQEEIEKIQWEERERIQRKEREKEERERIQRDETKRAEREKERLERERIQREERERLQKERIQREERERLQRETDIQISQQRLKQEVKIQNQQNHEMETQRYVNPQDLLMKQKKRTTSNGDSQYQSGVKSSIASASHNTTWVSTEPASYIEEENIYDTPTSYHSISEQGHSAAGKRNGVCARALYDYQAADDTEITFDPGDIITNVDTFDEGWWKGYSPDGSYGMFPANFVELI